MDIRVILIDGQQNLHGFLWNLSKRGVGVELDNIGGSDNKYMYVWEIFLQ